MSSFPYALPVLIPRGNSVPRAARRKCRDGYPRGRLPRRMTVEPELRREPSKRRPAPPRGRLPGRMTVEPGVGREPPKLLPVPPDDVDLEALQHRDRVGSGDLVAIALEHDPPAVAGPAAVVVQPTPIGDGGETPGLEVQNGQARNGLARLRVVQGLGSPVDGHQELVA